MVKIILAVMFTLATWGLSVNAQTPSTTKPAPPVDQDMNSQDDKDAVFPPDVVDTTIDDTSEINDVRVDSTIRMEDKRTYEDKEKMKKESHDKMKNTDGKMKKSSK